MSALGSTTPSSENSFSLWSQFILQQSEIQRVIKKISPDTTHCFIIYDETWLATAQKTNSIQKFDRRNDAASFALSNGKLGTTLIMDPFKEESHTFEIPQ